MKIFLGLAMMMEIVRIPLIESYWSLDELQLTPYRNHKMARNRFHAILANMYFAPDLRPSSRQVYRLSKVRPVLTRF